MPGYAYPVGATAPEYPTVTVNTLAVPEEDLFEGSNESYIGDGVIIYNNTDQKIRVKSVYVTNLSGGILPIKLVRGQVSDMTEYDIVHSSRVFKTKFIALPLVSGDTRTGGDADGEAIMTEFVLAPDDFLGAICPLADSLSVTTITEVGVK
jgi:hypothetical protein